MILSILIPTLPDAQSKSYLNRLLSILSPQIIGNEVEFIYDDSSKEVPTGTKRNNLISKAKGEYICQIDCDDLVPDYYVSEILCAIESTPDVITFIGYMTTSGKDRKNFTIKLGEKYEERNGHYYRYPNHLCVFKKSLVQDIKFKPIWVQEDYMWATEVRDKCILKTEVHITKDMYHYDFVPKYSPAIQHMRSRIR